MDPCEDFYAFACNEWNEAAQVEDAIEVQRIALRADEFQDRLGEALVSESAVVAGLSGEQLRDPRRYYDHCMAIPEDDQEAYVDQLQPLREPIATIDDGPSFWRAAGRVQRMTGAGLFSSTLIPRAPAVVVMAPEGVGLSELALYSGEDARSVHARELYRARIAQGMRMLGRHDPEELAGVIWALELQLAETRASPLEQTGFVVVTDPSPELGSALDEFVHAWGAQSRQGIVFSESRYLEALVELATTSTPEHLQAYLDWLLLRSFTRWMRIDWADDLEQIRWGQPRWSSRHEYCRSTSAWVFPSLEYAWTQSQIDVSTREATAQMFEEVTTTLRERVARRMKPGLATSVADELSAVRWRFDYEGERLDYGQPWSEHGTSMDALVGVYEARADAKIDAIGRQFSSSLALRGDNYYDPWAREIVVSLSSVTRPIFAPQAPGAVRYGAMGETLAHESIHVIDIPRREQPWLLERHRCLEDNYLERGVSVTASLMAEARADAGGLRVAYEAWTRHERTGHECEPVEGTSLGAAQLFFVAFAQKYCRSTSSQVQQFRQTSERHLDPSYRVNVSVAINEDFSRAFGCEPVSVEVCEGW